MNDKAADALYLTATRLIRLAQEGKIQATEQDAPEVSRLLLDAQGALELAGVPHRAAPMPQIAAPSVKQEANDDYDLRAEQAYFDRWPDIAAPSASQGEVKAAAAFELTGNVCEIGQLEDEGGEHGIVVKREFSNVTIKGLTMAEVVKLKPVFLDDIVISFAAAPSVTDGGVSGFYIEDNCGDTEI